MGLLVTGVEAGSAAECAGLIPGDIVLGVDGEDGVAGSAGRLLAGLRSGRRPLRLDLLRGGVRRTLVVAIAEAA